MEILLHACQRPPSRRCLRRFVPASIQQHSRRSIREDSPSAEPLTRIDCSAAQTAVPSNLYLLKNSRNSATSQARTASNDISGCLRFGRLDPSPPHFYAAPYTNEELSSAQHYRQAEQHISSQGSACHVRVPPSKCRSPQPVGQPNGLTVRPSPNPPRLVGPPLRRLTQMCCRAHRRAIIAPSPNFTRSTKDASIPYVCAW